MPVNADESVLEQTEPSDPAGMEILHIVIFLLLFFTSSQRIRLTVFFCNILCPLQFILELTVQICYYILSYSIHFEYLNVPNLEHGVPPTFKLGLLPAVASLEHWHNHLEWEELLEQVFTLKFISTTHALFSAGVVVTV